MARVAQCPHCKNDFETSHSRQKFCSKICKKDFPPNRLSHWNACLKSNYGIDLVQYNEMLKQQNGKCAICRSSDIGVKGHKNWPIDHDHQTKKVRGLICNFCNKGLGNFKDDPSFLRAAAEYLERNR